MKVWKRVRFLKKDKKIDMITKSYVNYIYENSPINEIFDRYKVSPSERVRLNQYISDRIAGLVVLSLDNVKERLNDIIIKYYNNQLLVGEITPEIEGFIDIK